MPNSLAGYNQYLTNLSTGIGVPSNLAWIHLFPFFPVKRGSDKYFKFDPARSVLRHRNLRVGTLDKSPVIDFGWKEDSYVCLERRLKGRYTRDQILNALPPQDPRRDCLEVVLNAINNITEKDVFDQVSASLITASRNRTVPSGKEWNKFGSNASDPIADVAGWKQEIKEGIVDWSNGRFILVLEDAVVEKLLDHPLIIARISGMGSPAAPAVANRETLARVLKVDEVIAVNSVINTALEGVETPNLVRTWSKGGMLIFRANGIVQKRPTFGYTFRHDGFEIDGARAAEGVVVYENKLGDPPNVFEIIAQRHDDFKVVANEAGLYLYSLIE